MQGKSITICVCFSRDYIDKSKVATITAILENEGYSVILIPDLCKKIMQKSPDIEDIASSIILACYPRAVYSLFRTFDINPQKVINIRNSSVKDIIEQVQIAYIEPVQDDCQKQNILNKIKSFEVENGTDAWYPVIDKERCTECGRCYDFCLFGVYTIEKGVVKVIQPQNCKNNCPACARMCPNKAIIFPKYKKSPINGGLDEEEHFDPEQVETMYKERIKMRLQQRRTSISLLNKNK